MTFKQFSTRLLFVLSLFVLGGCGGSSSSNNAPSIEAVFTDIMNAHPSFLEKWSVSPNRTIRFAVLIRVQNPSGLENIVDIYIRDTENDVYWDIFGGPNDVPLSNCYFEDIDAFECLFYNSASLHSINLQNWEVVITNNLGISTRQSFSFLLPGGEIVNNESFVYSESFVGSTIDGVQALEAMTIADNELVFESNPGSQSFRIEFKTTDTRARYYNFVFYDGTADINYVAEADIFSPSIESLPLIQGQKIVIDLPWSEIEFVDGAEISDIDGLHIKLFDEPIDWLPISNGLWFNYISYSEYLTL